MKVVRVILIALFDIIFLGAFVVCFPVLIQFFSNQIAAILIVGILIAGGGIVLGMGFLQCRPGNPGKSGADMNGGGLRRHM